MKIRNFLIILNYSFSFILTYLIKTIISSLYFFDWMHKYQFDYQIFSFYHNFSLNLIQ